MEEGQPEAPLMGGFRVMPDMKTATEENIVISGSERRHRTIFRPVNAPEYYSNGSTIRLDIKGYDNTVMDIRRAVLWAHARIFEYFSCPDNSAGAEEALAYLGNALTTLKIGANGLNYGTLGLIKKLTCRQGNNTFDPIDDYDIKSFIQCKLAKSSNDEEEVVGFLNPDIIWGDNIKDAYYIKPKAVDGTTDITDNEVATMDMKNSPMIPIPLGILLAQFDFWADYNSFQPITIEIELNKEYRMFVPIINDKRASLYEGEFNKATRVAKKPFYRVLGFDDIHDRIKLTDIKLIMDSYIVSETDLRSTRTTGQVLDVEYSNYGPKNSKITLELQSQKSSVKWVIPTLLVQQAGQKKHWESKKCYDIWIHPSTALESTPSDGYDLTTLKQNPYVSVNRFFMDYPVKVLAGDDPYEEPWQHAPWIIWAHGINAANSTPARPMGFYAVGNFFEYPVKDLKVVIGGKTYPENYVYYSKKDIYYQLLKEFHEYSIEGSHIPPYTLFSETSNEDFELLIAALYPRESDSTSTLVLFSHWIRKQFINRSNDELYYRRGNNVFARQTKLENGVTKLVETTKWYKENSTSFMPIMILNKYIGGMSKVIGGIDTERQKLNILIELVEAMVNSETNNWRNDLDYIFAVISCHDQVLELDGETGGINTMN